MPLLKRKKKQQQKSPFIICWLQFLMTALPVQVMTVHTMQQNLIKEHVIMMLLMIKCLFTIHTILLGQPMTQ